MQCKGGQEQKKWLENLRGFWSLFGESCSKSLAWSLTWILMKIILKCLHQSLGCGPRTQWNPPLWALRNELIELEKRVQSSAYQSENNEDSLATDDGPRYSDEAGLLRLPGLRRKKKYPGKSIVRLKETRNRCVAREPASCYWCCRGHRFT